MMIGITIKQPMTLNASFIKRPPCKLKFSISLFARRFDFCRWNSKIMVICASVCMRGMPDWLDLERYSFWLRHTWAADYTGHGRTSTCHFENPSHVRRPNTHRYSKSLASIEIPVLVFSEPLPTFIFLRFQQSAHPTSWDFSKAETLWPHYGWFPEDWPSYSQLTKLSDSCACTDILLQPVP